MHDKELVLDHLGILVTTYCNLNCRDCADLIPKRACHHYELDHLISDVAIVLENVDHIKEVLVIGGETLLYPWLSEVLDFCKSQQKIGKLIITTNGVSTPDERLLENFRRNKVLIRVSGYPGYVVPDRKKVLQKYKDSDLEVEDLESMQWYAMGNFKKRYRTEEELKDVFRTCAMKDCVTLGREGKIFFCSRQMTADETTFYPDPLENEFVNVRIEKNLRKRLREFYSLPYITTCDHCDGISCATKKTVPAAAQILKKETFLALLSLYFEIKDDHLSDLEKATAVMRALQLISDDIYRSYGVGPAVKIIELANKPECLAANWNGFMDYYLCLINELTKDYLYEVRSDSPYAFSQNIQGMRFLNRIIISDHADSSADILIEEQEIFDAVNKKWPVDLYTYNRLFVESKFGRIQNEDVKCIICGLPYTQYGILEKEMPVSTCNLSVTGQDIPYSILMAEKALEHDPGIEVVVIPIAYFQGCYDMSSDDAQLHRDVISYIDLPILGKKRNYVDKGCDQREQTILELYNHIYDLEKIREKRDKELICFLKYEDFFNEIFPQPLYGGLKFDAKMLSAEEKQKSAWITAQHNERVCTLNGYKETLRYLADFLRKMEEMKIKVLLFVPPATRYLVEASSKELQDFYYRNLVTKLFKGRYVRFLDLFDDERFDENDFCDFEHLNHGGAEKLTRIIGKVILNWS